MLIQTSLIFISFIRDIYMPHFFLTKWRHRALIICFAMYSDLVYSQTMSTPASDMFYDWFEHLCLLRACLDLNIFPHTSQGWETPVIWRASTCLGIELYGPSFPQTLHVAILPLPFSTRTSLFVIIDLIWESKSAGSELKATTKVVGRSAWTTCCLKSGYSVLGFEVASWKVG